MSRSSRNVRLSIATGGVLVLSACGQGTSSSEDRAPTPDEFMDRIIAGTTSAGSAHMSMDMGQAGSVEADMIFEDADSMVAEMTYDIPGNPMQIRLVDEMIYLKSKQSSGKWAVIDPSDPNDPLAAQFGDVSALNPTQQIDEIRDAVTKVEKVGSESVGDTKATHYVVTIDLEKATGSKAEDAEKLQKQGISELTYDYWIDPQDRMVKVTSDILGQTIEMNVTEWGEEFDIEAPEGAVPASELGLSGPAQS